MHEIRANRKGIFCVRLNAEPSARNFQPVALGIDPRNTGIFVLGGKHRTDETKQYIIQSKKCMTERSYPSQASDYSEIYTECEQALSKLTTLLSYMASSKSATPESDRYLRLELSRIQRQLSHAESLIFSDYNRPVFFD